VAASRKLYIALAKAVSDLDWADRHEKRLVGLALCHPLLADNQRFDMEKFLDACDAPMIPAELEDATP
jgi:hypothetical protein